MDEVDLMARLTREMDEVDLMARLTRGLQDAMSTASSSLPREAAGRCWVELAGRRCRPCRASGGVPSIAATSSAPTPVVECCSSQSMSMVVASPLTNEPERGLQRGVRLIYIGAPQFPGSTHC